MPTDPLLLAALACVAIATGVFAYLTAAASASDEALGHESTDREAPIDTPIMKPMLMIAKALAPLFEGQTETEGGKELDRKLRRAGRPFDMTVPVFLALRIPASMLGGLLGYAFSLAYADQAQLMPIGALMIFGWFYPGLRLKAVMDLRMLHIFRDLPYTIDLLALSTEAGQDFSSAMGTVVEKGAPGPLLDEFRIAHQEVILGKSRAESLRAMADRIDLQEMTSFVLALIQAEQLGTGISNVLRVMSEQTRMKRWQLAEEAAGRVPVKLMMPLVATIFPASFIVLFVPLIIQTWMI